MGEKPKVKCPNPGCDTQGLCATPIPAELHAIEKAAVVSCSRCGNAYAVLEEGGVVKVSNYGFLNAEGLARLREAAGQHRERARVEREAREADIAKDAEERARLDELHKVKSCPNAACGVWLDVVQSDALFCGWCGTGLKTRYESELTICIRGGCRLHGLPIDGKKLGGFCVACGTPLRGIIPHHLARMKGEAVPPKPSGVVSKLVSKLVKGGK